MKKTLALLLMGGALLNGSAATILTDDFSYPNGGIVTNAPVWLPNTGTGPALVQDGALVLTSARGEDIARALANGPYAVGNGHTLYASFTLKASQLPNAAGAYLAHFTGQDANGLLTGHRGRVWAYATDDTLGAAGANKFYLGIMNRGGKPVAFPTSVDLNVTYKVVVRYVVDTATSTIWVNPASESDPSATATDTVVATDIIGIGHFGFRQASGEGTHAIDDLKVGTSFGDVMGGNASPGITGISDQSIAANGNTGPLSFTVTDAETPAANLTVTAASSVPSLVPENATALKIEGGEATRTITVTPAPGQQGVATITLTVSDGANSSLTTFKVFVGAPEISPIADQITPVNTPTAAIPFVVGDAETPGSLIVTATSTNTALLQQNAKVVLSGAGENRTVKITPETDATGTTLITLTLTDGTQNVASAFLLTVYPKLGILLSDDFSYEDGVISGVSLSKWYATSSADSNDLSVVSGQVRLSPTNAMDASAYINNFQFVTASSGTLLYSKMAVKLETLPRGSGGSYFAHVKDSYTGTSYRGRIFALTNGAAAGKFRLGVANAAASVSAVLPVDLDLNTTNIVVARYNVGTGRSALWVNPRYESDENAMATDSASPLDVMMYSFRQDSSIGLTYVDDLVIGTSFEDVVPYVAPPTPIPLNIQFLNGETVVTWTNPAFKLQSAASITETFNDIQNATSPYTNSAGAPVFFRLKY